ncbi:tetratricopeptide repeat-containing protein [Saccharomycopsis crataegensis]|uniref:Tetratricopeptide repeat-containing protein n=1 Tax=Saccharomycopsis crataegensis TaxID=43959 RepID=A0AAV5QWK6_9ASCO|nr:tetratricopeptide repeat-containing protein [Saccharomycopsis crataegensis]
MNEERNNLLKQLHIHLLLLSPYPSFKKLVNISKFEADEQLKVLVEPAELILKGYSSKVLSLPIYHDIIPVETLPAIYANKKDINSSIREFSKSLVDNSSYPDQEVWRSLVLIYAIALGQCFVQLNYTGPSIQNLDSHEMFFAGIENSNDFHREVLASLELQGLAPYELCDDPILLVMSLHIFEALLDSTSWTLLGKSDCGSVEHFSDKSEATINAILANKSISQGVTAWWRSRYLQVQMSLFIEPSSIICSICSHLHSGQIINDILLTDYVSEGLIKQLYTSYYLESARNSIHAEIETLTIPSLEKAKTLSNLELVLTGAKARRTKYQQKAVSSLIVLAKSTLPLLPNDEIDSSEEQGNFIENKELNSDFLLEVPKYESLNDEAVNEIMENDDIQSGKSLKRIKLSFDGYNEQYEESTKTNQQRLLPIAIRTENIPQSLKELDANEQPRLNDLDSIQVFLRMMTLRQISPSGSHLIEEELAALVSRVIANNAEDIRKDFPAMNWLLFSKALWERSWLEATKAKTIERGIFQMQALVEEMNAKIQTRLFPVDDKQIDGETCSSATRLRYINQLPLAPRWSLDVDLAEKFMSIGVIKSAVEIYERLQMVNDMAACYISVGQEAEAEKVLRQRLETHPNDSRSMSILGGLTQDPTLWEKAWELNKYQGAKVSLARYYYNKKHEDRQNMLTAIKHMNEALTQNPLNFQNWYFYGCLGLESEQYELAAEAFTRCVSIEDAHNHSWSNLGSALLNINKPKEAFNAYQNAIRTSEVSNWRIWENYLTTAVKVGDWIQVIRAAKTLIELKNDESAINMRVVDALVAQITSEEYPTQKDGEDEVKLTFLQKSSLDYICNQVPKVNTKNSRLWKVQARVELWAKKPWNSLNCMEKAYRVDLNNENLLTDESVWDAAVESCADLVASYESLGEMPGKHGAGDLVCKDWKFKARSSIRTLMSKGKMSWEDSNGWDKLVEIKSDL